MKKITAAIIGYGNRGEIYGDYSIGHPDELEIVSVVDINDFNLNKAKRKYNIRDEYCFKDIKDFLNKGKICDCVINATMDKLHIETTLPLLKLGYDVLLEKPICSNKEDLLALKRLAETYKRKLIICHVLRYTPFYQRIKEALEKGNLGDIIHIEASEYVGIPHMLTSYVRGKWNSEKICGSSFLLAKSCHDLDLICWLNKNARPVEVSSFGARSVYVPENAPKESGNYCLVDCPLVDNCDFSSKKMYIENDCMPFLTWADLDMEYEKITNEQKIRHLNSSDFGKCAYKTNGDIYDHQTVIINFDNKTTANFNLISCVSKPGRHIHIICTKGEIEGFLESNVYYVRRYSPDNLTYTEERCDVTDMVTAGHSGGDLGLMRHFVRSVKGSGCLTSTSIDDSINGHLCVFAADESTKTKKVVLINH